MVTLDAPPAYDESLSQIDLTLTADPSGKDILITVKPPAAPTNVSKTDKDEKVDKEELKAKRAPIDFVLTIDVSGSMGEGAPVPGENERTGLSVLDVVKHAANTIITTMRSEDRIAIVSFSGTAKVVLPLTHTTEEGKSKALKEVGSLRPLDSTNLWDGLKQSMNLLTGAPPASDPESPAGAIASLATTGNAIAAGIANMTVGTSLPPPQYVDSINRLSSIFLLTDGQPHIVPPRGHIPMLKLYLDSQPKDKTKFTINTFGFGYSLDSKLLNEIAKVGNGHFGFIADSGMVGTNFVHAVANTYATYAEGLFVDIEVDDAKVAKNMEVLGSFEANRASGGVQVPLGQLQYGQTRDLVVRLPRSLSKSPVTVTARCRPWDSDDEVKATRVINDAHLPPSESTPDPGLLYHTFRLDFVSAVHKEIVSSNGHSYGNYSRGWTVPPNAETVFQDLASRIRVAFPGKKPADPSPASDALDLAGDISGQVRLGIADYRAFNKWGLHYLLSLSRSHQRQQCGNFKDPGLQPYGRQSVLFKSTRDEIDTTFDDLPPPKPSLWVSSYSGFIPPTPLGGAPPQPRYTGLLGVSAGGSLVAAGSTATTTSYEPSPYEPSSYSSSSYSSPPRSRAPPPSRSLPRPQLASLGSTQAFVSDPLDSSASFKMSRYNRRSAPCFAGSSLIQLYDGNNIPVQHLVVGSSVKTPLGSAKVIGIVRTRSPNGSFNLCELGDGLLITPWHPVYVAAEGTWRFPADIATPKQATCDSVYSLILEENEDSDGHAVFIGGIRCVTMGHGVVDPADVRSHPFLSNHFSVMKELKTHANFSKEPVEALGAIKDIETGLMCGFAWKRDAEPSSTMLPYVPSLLDLNPRTVTVKA
ncbi:hypothetical protein FRC00_010789 [Tulasnella sp. 408]|nr:hypothetical protein FRC00_010789 [Tulasnella sp. 408]